MIQPTVWEVIFIVALTNLMLTLAFALLGGFIFCNYLAHEGQKYGKDKEGSTTEDRSETAGDNASEQQPVVTVRRGYGSGFRRDREEEQPNA